MNPTLKLMVSDREAAGENCGYMCANSAVWIRGPGELGGRETPSLSLRLRSVHFLNGVANTARTASNTVRSRSNSVRSLFDDKASTGRQELLLSGGVSRRMTD